MRSVTIETTGQKTRLEELRDIIVEDAAKAKASSDDQIIKALVERALIESTKSSEPEALRSEAPAEEAGRILTLLHEKKADMQLLSKTFRTLYVALLRGFIETKNDDIKRRLAGIIRVQPNFEPQNGQWETALREELDRCFNGGRLREFIAESDNNSNRTALIKFSQRRAGLVSLEISTDRLLFEARCGHAIGSHLSLAAGACIGAIGYAACVAKLVQSIRLPFGVPSKQEIQMPNIDFVRIIWWTAPREELGAAIENGTSSMDKWAEEIRQQVGPRPSRIYNLDIALRILPYSYGWEHTADTTEPLHTIVRSI